NERRLSRVGNNRSRQQRPTGNVCVRKNAAAVGIAAPSPQRDVQQSSVSVPENRRPALIAAQLGATQRGRQATSSRPKYFAEIPTVSCSHPGRPLGGKH